MPTVFTIGHSNRSEGELFALLAETGVRTLVDVRRMPGSRRHPQFNRGALARTCEGHGVAYHWMGETLGGRRDPELSIDASPNAALTEPAFRHYADALPRAEVQAAVAELEARARAAPTAFLCAERDWRHCHRQILADLLSTRSWSVVHLLDRGERDPHRLHAHARVRAGRLCYPTLL